MAITACVQVDDKFPAAGGSASGPGAVAVAGQHGDQAGADRNLNLSSADAKACETVGFEVLDEERGGHEHWRLDAAGYHHRGRAEAQHRRAAEESSLRCSGGPTRFTFNLPGEHRVVSGCAAVPVCEGQDITIRIG
jgi:hypothetical protein